MSDLKPLGSEKLNGDEKLKRILELTYFNSNKKTAQTSKAELVKESKSGGVYAIVKEKDSYYVKKGLTESSVDYIGGMYMKNKNRFSSYSEALKRLELIKGQEELINETKYFLKKKEDAAPAPEAMPPAPDASAPDVAMPPAPNAAPADGMDGSASMGDMEGGAPAPDADAAPDANAEGGDGKENEPEDEYAYMGEVHKFTGKLQEELRKQEKRLTSKDIKWVLNMVISSLDLDKLEDKDLEEIADKFDRDEIHDADGEESETGVGGDEPTAEETPNEDLGEEADPLSQLEEFINEPSPFDEIDLSSYADNTDEPSQEADMNEKKKPTAERPPLGAHGETHLEEVEIDMDEIKNEIHKSIGETLSKYFN